MTSASNELAMLFEVLLGLAVLAFHPPATPTVTEVAPVVPLEMHASIEARLQLSESLAVQGRLVGALDAARSALADAVSTGDAEQMPRAREQVESLLTRLPHVRFVSTPSLGANAEVRFDGRPVPSNGGDGGWSVDPGHHVVLMTSDSGGKRVERKLDIDVVEGATVLVPVASTMFVASAK